MVLKGRFLTFLFYMLTLIAAAARADAAEVYVPSGYKTIQEAVNNAFPGDSVIVSEGIYKENIVVTKPLVLRSVKGSDATIVQAAVSKAPVFKILNTDGVAITGFTATGSAAAGISIRNSTNVNVADNKTVKNESGILIYSSRGSVLKNNIVSENELYGVYLEASSENTVEKNTVESNNDKGIYLNSSNNNSIMGNSVKLNLWNGIILWLSDNNTVKDNNVFRNRYGIVIAESKNNLLINNSNWPNIYLILPMVLAYIAILLFFIQRKIFSLLEK